MTLFLAIVGWLTAAFFALAYYSCRQNKLGWRRLCAEKDRTIRELERLQLAGVQADPDGLKWYREENARLAQKCAAICKQIRRMKGRGRVSCQMHPTHNF